MRKHLWFAAVVAALIGASGCEYYTVRPTVVSSGDDSESVAAPKTNVEGKETGIEEEKQEEIIRPVNQGTSSAPSLPAPGTPPTSAAPGETPVPGAPLSPSAPSTPAPQPAQASPADNVAPSVTETAPAYNATNVPTTTKTLRVRFSEPMKPETVKLVFVGPTALVFIPVPGVADGSNTEFHWDIKTNLDPDGKYIARVMADAEDLAGNKMGAYFEWSFQTEPAPKGFQRVVLTAEGPSLREYYRIDGSGGAGGAAVEVACNEGEAMVGLKLLATGAIDKVMQYACQNIAQLKDSSKRRWEAVNNTRPAGTADAVKTYEADAGEVFVGFYSKTVEKDDSLVVGEFAPYFAKLTDSGVDEGSRHQSAMISGDGSSDTWSSQLCPKGFVQSGLRIRAGGYVDRLGSVCRRVALANEAKPSVKSMASIALHEGYEFGFVEYDWTPDSNGAGENSQPCLGGEAIKSFECEAGYGLIGIALHGNEIVDDVYGISCQNFAQIVSSDESYKTTQEQAKTDGNFHIIEAQRGIGRPYDFLTGWSHKRSEDDTGGDNDLVMVSELSLIQQVFLDNANGLVAKTPEAAGHVVGQGVNWDGADDNYTDWITEACPSGFVLSGLKLKMESGRPRALGGVCRRVIPAGQEPGMGEKNPQP